jgi:hypothetical protein
LARAPALQAGGPGFESLCLHQTKSISENEVLFLEVLNDLSLAAAKVAGLLGDEHIEAECDSDSRKRSARSVGEYGFEMCSSAEYAHEHLSFRQTSMLVCCTWNSRRLNKSILLKI